MTQQLRHALKRQPFLICSLEFFLNFSKTSQMLNIEQKVIKLIKETKVI